MQPQTRSRVLCVDDDADACEMLTVLMSAYGIDAICAPSAAEAWREIDRQTFDLYVLDGWLPQVDGFEFCRRLRETDSMTPIVFYSGAAYDADKQRGMAAGANAYIAKPDVEGLIATISNLSARVNTPASFAWERELERKSGIWFLPGLVSVENVSD